MLNYTANYLIRWMKMKKTLNELLKEKRYKNVNLKIGSVSGSSFWFCGKNSPYTIRHELKEAQDKCLKQNKRNLGLLKERLRNIDKIYANNLEKAKGKRKDFEKYKKELEIKKQRELKQLPKKIKSIMEDIETNLLDREVREVVRGICVEEQPCYVVYVKGGEKGPYWTIKEYNDKRNKGEQK